ncbi:MAG: FAD-dependent oxidoreductase [Burkholderiales bacterium]|nr:FAD-dependent oxidoreductase [Burkholderiales bacterium]
MSDYSALERVRADIMRCYRCGYCRDMVRDLTGTYHPCPVRERRRHEHYSARGRNTIARGIIDGRLNVSYDLRDLVYTCLSCDGCRDACSLVDWAKIDSPAINQAMRDELHRLGMTPEKIRNVQQVKSTRSGPGNKATCRIACPLEQDVPGYVGLIARGAPVEALEVIRKTNPLPSVCGRACTHPCEPACRQSEIGEPVAIRSLKRFCIDQEKKSERPVAGRYAVPAGPRIAVIGSGPAGISAANHLGRDGFRVTVFEKDSVPGGMMTTVIPDFTLRSDDVMYDIERVKELGVEIRTGVEIPGEKGLRGLIDDGFAAVLVCGGAWSSARIGIAGEDLDGVRGALEFLRSVKCGEDIDVGNRVVVVGGGKTALDAARSAMRLGAREVVIVYRRHREKAPFEYEDLLRALEEGVRFTDSVVPTEFIGFEGRVHAVRLRAASGATLRESEARIEADTVIVAIGQKADLPGMDGGLLRVNESGNIVVDAGYRASSSLPIFAAGDVVNGPTSIVEAMASGRDAAMAAAALLGRPARQHAAAGMNEARVPPWPVAHDAQRVHAGRTPMGRIGSKRRRATFDEVDRGFSMKEAAFEASRCLGCDGDRLSGLPVTDGADTLFFIGCNNYYRYPEVARSAVEVLARGGMQVTVADGEQCCGSPAFWSGNAALAQQSRDENHALFEAMGIKRIVTACADCHEMLGRHYELEKHGISVEHFAETLAGLLADGKLRLKDYEGVVTYHDPCQLARKAGVVDEPRAVFGAIDGLRLAEMRRAKKGTQCCGGGPNRLVHLSDPELAREIGEGRLLSEARETGADAVITACSWCHTQFEGLGKHDMPVYDLPYFINHVVGIESGCAASPSTADGSASLGDQQ